jgi:hypothetical protein
MTAIFKSNGTYFGFIANANLYSRDGEYLGWVEGVLVWDKNGQFRGQLWASAGHQYIIARQFGVPPVPRPIKPTPAKPPLPPPQANIAAIALPPGWADAF